VQGALLQLQSQLTPTSTTRCSSPTCAICSRTCTSTLPSIPPTPLLTRSSTPLPISPSQSPRRLALTLQSTNTALYDLQLSVANVISNTGKRRKAADEGDDEGPEGRLSEFDLLPGCGRIICRNCCFEDVQRCVHSYIIALFMLNVYSATRLHAMIATAINGLSFPHHSTLNSLPCCISMLNVIIDLNLSLCHPGHTRCRSNSRQNWGLEHQTHALCHQRHYVISISFHRSRRRVETRDCHALVDENRLTLSCMIDN
jgi:hypothetical protein